MENKPIFLNHLEVVHDRYLPNKQITQIKFPKSKKKRIRKKWSKNPKNSIITASSFFCDNKFYVCTDIYNELLQKL